MMNGIALCFVLTALVTGGVLSPPKSSDTHHLNDNGDYVIVKEGHVAVVVEYEKEGDGNTKVLISPHDHKSKVTVDDDDFKEKVEEIAAAAAAGERRKGPRELVCDAFGKCTHRIASALGRTKDVVTEKVGEVKEVVEEKIGTDRTQKLKEDVEEKVKEGVGKVKEVGGAVKDTVGKVKGIDSNTPEKIKEDVVGNVTRKVEETKEQVKGAEEMVEKGTEALKTGAHKAKDSLKSIHRAMEGVEEMAEKAKESVESGAHRVSEKTKESVEGSAHRFRERVGEMSEKAKDSARKVEKEGEDMVKLAADRVRDGAQNVEEMGKTTVAKAKDAIEDMGRKGKKDLKEIVRQGKEVLHDMVMFLVWPDWMDAVLRVVHLLGFSLVYGMSMWVTFVSSNLLAGNLSRQQFGMLQSKIYPVYFKVQIYCIGVALVGHLLSHRKRVLASSIETFHGLNLLAALLMALGNLLYLEPKATKVMFERIKLEKEEGRGRVAFNPISGIAHDAGDPVLATTERQVEVVAKSRSGILSEKLTMLNKYSSFLNVMMLTSLSLHLVYLGQRLHPNV